ncbi:MAG TPA: choice-of-anchor X domain-containing protein [Pyrinomonadaceae bacterium]|nr:choice-of-anchor X domain-containing protein [Pyrinomonadaceae bacterium]
MKLSRANCLKCGAVLLALTLFTGSVLVGDGPASAAAPTAAPMAAQTEGDGGPPQVESVSATPLDSVAAEDGAGNARLLVRFVAGETVKPQVNVVIDDRDVLLRDDGEGGDEVAGDGTFSAIVTIDFNALADNQDEIQAINALPEPSPTPEDGPTAEQPIEAAAAQRTQEEASASLATSQTVSAEERADTDLNSDTSVVMPDFDAGRDFDANKATPLVDFRNVRPGQVVPLWRIGTWRRIDPARSLVITSVRVVEDPTRTINPCTNVGNPNGPWTFKTLMTAMANQPVTGINPSTFVRNWLNKWLANQVVNGFTVAQRQQMQTLVIDPWVAASGGPLRPLDLNKAPFKLLAIVNRVDLRSNSVYGGGSAGEGRFVFGVIDRRPTGKIDPYTGQPQTDCRPMQFTVIFEYGIDRTGCAIRDWGRQWFNLRHFALGSAAYNAALQAITDQFTRANAAPHKPNRSALNQLRTNEVELLLNPPTNPVWELREFRIGGDPGVNPGQLEMATVKLTPDLTHNRTPLLTSFVNLNTPLILIEKHDVPLTFMGVNFLGGSSLAPRNPALPVDVNTHWNNPQNGPFITNREARHKFSLNTCNACHTGETNTVFTHIKPVAFGTPAGLSGFMNGIDPNTGARPFKVVDPADGNPTRKFNEFRRRAIDLDMLVHQPCFFDIHRRGVPPIH